MVECDGLPEVWMVGATDLLSDFEGSSGLGSSGLGSSGLGSSGLGSSGLGSSGLGSLGFGMSIGNPA